MGSTDQRESSNPLKTHSFATLERWCDSPLAALLPCRKEAHAPRLLLDDWAFFLGLDRLSSGSQIECLPLGGSFYGEHWSQKTVPGQGFSSYTLH